MTNDPLSTAELKREQRPAAASALALVRDRIKIHELCLVDLRETEALLELLQATGSPKIERQLLAKIYRNRERDKAFLLNSPTCHLGGAGGVGDR